MLLIVQLCFIKKEKWKPTEKPLRIPGSDFVIDRDNVWIQAHHVDDQWGDLEMFKGDYPTLIEYNSAK